MSRSMKRKLRYLTAALCLASMTFSPLMVSAQTPDNSVRIISPYVNDPYEERTSLQPLGGGYSVDDLLAWSPQSDPDARYARSAVPLQDRFLGPVVNPNANPDAKIMNCALTNADSNNAATQGGDIAMNYMFSYWQYIDSYIYWAGVEEGIFAIPTPDVIDVAHKNGVPIVATVGFPWGSGSGYVQEVRKFCQKDENGNFPVADKMLEMAEFYGFDGYFINQESYGCNATDAKNLVDMMIYMQEKNPDFIISWYDSMGSSGGIGYADSLTPDNSMYFQKDGKVVTDEFFLNYNWTKAKTDVTVQTAKELGRSPFDVFSGLNVQEESYNKYFPVKDLLDEQGKLRTSLAMYCPNSTLSMAKDVEDFYKHDQIFWVGKTGDPAHTDTKQRWVGLANYVADKSAINETPFVTNFNTGHGYTYSIDGEVSRTREWNNRSVQEYLPTWRWTVESDGSKLAPNFDFTAAYNGGNSLKVEGKLEATNPNHIKLYSTDLKITNDTPNFSITYKPSGTGAKMQVGLCFGETYDEDSFEFFDVAAGTSGQWNTDTIALNDYVGKSIKAISLKFSSDADIANYKMNIGQFAIKDTNVNKVAATDKITLDEIMFHNAYSAEVRMYWDKVSDPDLAYYEIYRIRANGDKEYVGMTPNNAYYISPFDRDGEEETVEFEVVSVDQNYKRGEAQSVTIDWSLALEDTDKPSTEKPVNLALNKPVKASRENSGEPALKAVDGTVDNNSKWCDSLARSGWLNIDLGEEKTIQRWVVKHGESGGEAPNTNTRDFDLQVSRDGGLTYQNVDVVNGNTLAVTDRNLTAPVTGQHFRLNVRNSGSSPWVAVRIYEFELYEEVGQEKTDYVPMQFVKATNHEGAADTVTFKKVPAGQTVRLYKAIGDEEALAEKVAGASGEVVFEGLDLGASEGRVYYATKAPDKAESLKMSVAFENEAWKATPIPTNLKLTDYQVEKTALSTQYYATLEIDDLKPGEVVNYYESEGDLTPKKASVPVAAGSTTAVIERILLDSEGGMINLETKREGMQATRFNAVYKADKEIATGGKIQINVTSTNGIAMQSAFYDIYKDGEKVGEIATDNAGVGVSKALEPGIYTLKFSSALEGYVPDAKEYTVEITEPFELVEQDIVLEIKVKEVADLTATVAQFEAYKLPTSVTATLSDLSTQELPVTWDKEVNTTEIGTFEFLGTVNNYDKKVKLTLTVEATEAAEMGIKAVKNPSDLKVEFGTAVEALKLPEQVTVVLENDTEVDVKVNWDKSSYDGSVAGTYTLTGDLALSRSVTNPEGLKASIKVIVGEKGIGAPIATLEVEGKVEAGVEKKIDYTVHVGNLEDVNMFEVTLTYNPDQLTYKAAPLKVPNGIKIQAENKPGKIKVTFGTTVVKDLIDLTSILEFNFKTSTSIKEGDVVKVELDTVRVVSIDENDKTTLHTIVGEAIDSEVPGQPAGPDINGDKKVTLEDLSIAMKYYMTDQSMESWEKAKKCDINGDGIIDLADIIAIATERTDI